MLNVDVHFHAGCSVAALDKFIPSPRCTQPLFLSMYEFVGKSVFHASQRRRAAAREAGSLCIAHALLLSVHSYLCACRLMGVAIRTNNTLELDLPSIVWKVSASMQYMRGREDSGGSLCQRAYGPSHC